jgi:hypothetical protein
VSRERRLSKPHGKTVSVPFPDHIAIFKLANGRAKNNYLAASCFGKNLSFAYMVSSQDHCARRFAMTCQSGLGASFFIFPSVAAGDTAFFHSSFFIETRAAAA